MPESSGWTVVGASVIGTAHQAADGACEDASGWRIASELVCLVVADGAGTRSRADQGARLAVDRVVGLAEALASGGVPGPETLPTWMRTTFAQVRQDLADAAEAAGESIDDYATTLGVAVVAADTACIGQVGDTIAVLGNTESFEAVDPPRRFEYVNETEFVTDPAMRQQLRLSVRPAAEIGEVFLATDGLRFKILDDLATGHPYQPFFHDLASYLRGPDVDSEAIRQFLLTVDDQSGDDKSLVAAARIAADRVAASGGSPC